LSHGPEGEGSYAEALEGLAVTNSQLQKNTLTLSFVTGQVGLFYRF